MSSATGYLVTVLYDDGSETWVHKNESDAKHEADVQRDAPDSITVHIEPVGVYLGEDEEWHITR